MFGGVGQPNTVIDRGCCIYFNIQLHNHYDDCVVYAREKNRNSSFYLH